MGQSDMFSLQGKVIVVTGGTGVLGAGFVKGIAAQGGIPIILGQNVEKGNERVAEVKAMFLKVKKNLKKKLFLL